jgi:ubiquinone/menaquinone biosynthesis C-methylase UbiE
VTPDRAPDFDARAQHYDTLRPTNDAWWSRFHALVELGDLRGRRILDIGCGTGQLATALAGEARAKVWGVDASTEMVRVARARVPKGVGVRQARAEALPFRDAWFERATMSLVVHLVNRPAAFAEARRVTGPRGRVAIATFAHEHFEKYWLNALFPRIAEIDRMRFPTESELAAELATAGFESIWSEHLSCVDELDRETALERIRGRHISTFDLLEEAEVEEGTLRAEAELPAVIVRHFEQLVVVGA